MVPPILSMLHNLISQAAHTYGKGHILVGTTLQQTQNSLLGLLPRYNIYEGPVSACGPNIAYKF